MPDDIDLTDAIADAAEEPKRASGDGQSVEKRSISEMIEADKYIKGQRAAARGLPVKYVKFVPPGTC